MEAYVKTVGVRILDVPYHLDIEYTYYIPDGMPEIERGDFLLVPFGAGNKKFCAAAKKGLSSVPKPPKRPKKR